jgi:glycosyltransferase involved in cell wall biosynthesis
MPSDRGQPQDNPLRVLEMCTDFGLGGIARHTLDLQRWLNGRGHQIFLGGSIGEWAGPTTDDRFLDIPIRNVGSGGGNLLARLGHMVRAVLTMRRWLRDNPVDLIHAHESAPALVANLARKGRNIPLIVTYHGSEPERIRSFGAIARRADLVITPSHRSAEDLATIGRVPRERLKVIGLGIKPPPTDDPKDVEALRAELLGDGTHLIVTVARIAYQKGIDVLIDCVQRLKDSHPHYRFVVIGDGPLLTEMRALARQKDVASHLTLAGRSETPFRYLRAADLMLLTSRWEALPISIAEAFQAGTPVVATDCSGVVELVDDTVGACVPKGDVDAICRAVAGVLEDASGLQAKADAAAERSRESRFDPAAVNAQFEATYRALAARRDR